MRKQMAFSLALLTAAAFAASPAVAQDGHRGRGRDHESGEHHRGRGRDDDHHDGRRGRGRDDDHQDDRRSRGRDDSRRFTRRVPPGWCVGRGNPHNTVANCGPGRDRYERRYDPRYNRSGSGRGSVAGSYGGGRQGFEVWKRNHDAQCHNLSRQRPLDLRWQKQVRDRCVAEERDARRRYGL